MANDWNNVKPVGCKPWLVLPAVYGDALSYGEQIAHFCAALNKLIQNNNTLPEYIQQMIQDYINGDVIGEVVQNIVSQFILNVKYPPENLKSAVGDGSADDTEAIQGCINYAKNHNGMAVYIPSGAYSVQSLTLPGDVSLFGFDRYTTKLVLRGGATTPMISSAGTGFSIVGLTLDANAGVQVEDINILSLTSQDVLLRDLIVQNGYQLLVYNGTGGHLQLDNIVFGNAVYRCVNISGSSIVQAKNLKFTQLSTVSGVDVINIASDGGMYDFTSNVSCETCLSVSGNDNYFSGIVSGATTPYADSGLRNTIDFIGYGKKEYYSNNIDTTVGGDTGFTANGSYFENISGAFTSVRNGTESKIVTGASTEQYNFSQTETIVGKKTITAQDIQLNPTNPLQYKTPSTLNGFFYNLFNSIQFKDSNNITYDILVKKENFDLGFHNVKYYGVTGDGVTDDTAAIQNVLNMGGLIYFPPGNYLVTESIYPIANSIIFGSNSKIFTNQAITIFRISINSDSDESVYNVLFENLELYATNNTGDSTGFSLVQNESVTTNKMYNIKLNNLYIHNFTARGINTYGGPVGSAGTHPMPTLYVTNCYLSTIGRGHIINSGVTILISNNRMYGTTSVEFITIDNGCESCIVTDNLISGSSQGAGAISTDETSNLIISNNIIIQNGNVACVALNNNSGDTIKVNISNNNLIGGNYIFLIGSNHKSKDIVFTGNIANNANWFNTDNDFNGMFSGNSFAHNQNSLKNLLSHFTGSHDFTGIITINDYFNAGFTPIPDVNSSITINGNSAYVTLLFTKDSEETAANDNPVTLPFKATYSTNLWYPNNINTVFTNNGKILLSGSGYTGQPAGTKLRYTIPIILNT